MQIYVLIICDNSQKVKHFFKKKRKKEESMSDVITAKLNTGYFDVVYAGDFNALSGQRGRKKASHNEVFILSQIDSYGAVTGFRSFFTEKLSCGVATVSRKIKKLVDDELITIERLANGKTEYKINREKKKDKVDPFYRVYNFFCSHVFEFNYKEKKDESGNVVKPARTEKRKLTPAEVMVLALIFTHSSKRKNAWFWGSAAKIADMLALSERQVERAIVNLMAAGLIFRPVRGKNRVRNSKYVANMKVLRPLCEYYKKTVPVEATATAKKAVVSPMIEAANAKAAREKYYADRREVDAQKADRYKNWVLAQSPRYLDLVQELNAMSSALAKAEVYNLPTLATLRAKEATLRTEKGALMIRFGIDDRRLEPDGWACCSRCKDTGFLPDGKACTCYPLTKGSVGELKI